jgi:hypothetical protein
VWVFDRLISDTLKGLNGSVIFFFFDFFLFYGYLGLSAVCRVLNITHVCVDFARWFFWHAEVCSRGKVGYYYIPRILLRIERKSVVWGRPLYTTYPPTNPPPSLWLRFIDDFVFDREEGYYQQLTLFICSYFIDA